MKRKKPIDPNAPLSYPQQMKLLRKQRAFWKSLGVDDPEQAPTHVHHLRWKYSDVTDEDLLLLTGRVRSVHLLDLDGADITNEGVRHLARMEYVQELRLKECGLLDEGCLPFLAEMTGLELLHLGGTAIPIAALDALQPLQKLRLLLVKADDTEEIRGHLHRLQALLPDCILNLNHQQFTDTRPWWDRLGPEP
ncbi:MAG: hypothetical protein EOO11_06650 [Chitinophagaceae bacterium]|nr:MAG: hypothetical protein EOO11_06650 [Chitinophagaceae bacterium]